MRAPNGFLAKMALFSRFRSHDVVGWSPDDAIATRLLADQDAGPDASPSQQALALILKAAAQPGTEPELSAQAAAIDAFILATKTPRARVGTRAGKPLLARRTPVLATAITAVLIAGVCGTAAANALPAPLQRFAHITFGAPAPDRPALAPTDPQHSHDGSTRSVRASQSAPSRVSNRKPTGHSTSPAGKAKATKAPTSKAPTSAASSSGNSNGGNGNAGNGNGNGGNGNGNGGNGNGNGGTGNGNGTGGNGTGTGTGTASSVAMKCAYPRTRHGRPHLGTLWTAEMTCCPNAMSVPRPLV
jgi:hypothetical protein